MNVTTTLIIIGIIAGWGLIALLLLSGLLRRARRLLLRPILREDAPAVTCRRCRLPFHAASWRCGRCGAPMRPWFFYLVGRWFVRPLLTLIILPWILAVGMLLSVLITLTRFLMPAQAEHVERLAARGGNLISPLFARWVPRQWRIYSESPRLEPGEIDAPVDTALEAAFILGAALLGTAEGELTAVAFSPSDETLDLLRREKGGIHELWGYVSDSRVLVPTYTDQIIGALIHHEDLTGYVDGLAYHLDTPGNRIEIEPSERIEKAGTQDAPWRFHIRRIEEIKGEYPLRWEVEADPATLLRIESLIDELVTWDTLPCRLEFR